MRRLAGVVCGLVLAAATAQARIVRIEVKPTSDEALHGVPKSYHVVQGLAYGEVDPRDTHNRILTDLGLAPKNARGMVEYVATFTLYVPSQPDPNAVLLYDVVNRGGMAVPGEFANNDFFLVSGWQGDIPFGGRALNGIPGETIKVPVAHNADGSAITGPAFARWIDEPAGRKTLVLSRSITYITSGTAPTPLDLDTRHAHLMTKTHEDVDGTVHGLREIPASDWAWGDCEKTAFPGRSNAAKICLKDGFDKSLLYELRYTAKDPLILGLGFAAVRDINQFFLTKADDGHGFINPVAGHVKAAIATGSSQSGNYLRSFVSLGFNEGEDGRKVFEGVMPMIAARQLPLNLRFGVPGGTTALYELGTDGVNWWAHVPDTLRHHPPGGELDRCEKTKTCPKIMELMGSAEFYSLRASMTFTGSSAKSDLPLPENVRRYYMNSATHGGGAGGFYVEPSAQQLVVNCDLAANPVPEKPTRRALILAMKQWVVDGTAPPPSMYPTLKDKTLIPAQDLMAKYPKFPGATFTPSMLNPNLIYRVGPKFNAVDVSGIASEQPPTVLGAAPAVVPTVDADGNEIGGIRAPLRQNPLGTYTGWNPTSTGFRKGEYCSLRGGYIPFARTKAEREAKHDPRLSLEERYPSHAEYVRRVRASAEAMVKQRLLLEDDAQKMIAEAEASDVRR
jgi:hypothetical protein